MALLVRRVRERLQPDNLLCIGTSATMASVGSQEDKNRVVAGVASKLFGNEIAESNVITETLERITDSTATADSVRPSLGEAIDSGTPRDIPDAALREHPLAVWVETRLGISFSEVDQRWVRARPMTVSEAVKGALERLRSVPRRLPEGVARPPAGVERPRAGADLEPNRDPWRQRGQLLRVQAPPVHLRRRPRLGDARSAGRTHGDGRRSAVPPWPRRTSACTPCTSVASAVTSITRYGWCRRRSRNIPR